MPPKSVKNSKSISTTDSAQATSNRQPVATTSRLSGHFSAGNTSKDNNSVHTSSSSSYALRSEVQKKDSSARNSINRLHTSVPASSLTSSCSNNCNCSLSTELVNKFNQMVADCEARFKNVLLDFQSEFSTLIADLTSRLDALTTDYINLEKKVVKLEMANEESFRKSRLSDAVIRGIPVLPGDDPMSIVKSISDTLNHTLSPYAVAFRMVTKQNKDKNKKMNKNVSMANNNNNDASNPTGTIDAPIIVRFSSASEQRVFLGKFKARNGMKLNDLPDFSTACPFYINESLTPKNAFILRRALSLHRGDVKCSVFTRNGLVIIKDKTTNAKLWVRNVDQLNSSSLN